ncbi:MAG: MATE family efflux transporter [Deltaproteobacteria bacterium HGW-Deltaproteobacteria-19]|jgi:putative MATE family efflux protein|nr:MAG: MATE family efflux transporter [Deltaproteobacteria bacterium HGW-Deltaproteobacteria-19]
MLVDQQAADDLGRGKTGRLLLQYSIPAIVGMVAASLYNIIDRVFIGQGVGALAISGMAITLPIMNMAVAFGAWIGIGASAMVSIRLGEKKGKEANLILGNALVLNIIISIAFSAVALIYLDRILYLFGASRETLPYAKEFMQIILIGNIFTHILWGLNSIMRSSGYPRKAMVITLVTIGINLVLAPLFIFAFRWGIRGAAAATVLSQVVGTVWVVIHFMSGKSQVHFERGQIGLRANVVRDILSVGMPSFLLYFCACFIVILLNLRLVMYGGDFAVGAFGIINSIVMFFIMVVIGLNQGMQPIVGYNYGARQGERVFRTFRYTVIAATGVTAAGFLMAECIPGLIARAFTTHQELIDLSTTGMRIVFVMFPLVGFQMVSSNLFQSIGKAKVAIFLSLSRQVLFLIPLLFVLSHAFGLEGVWVALPASDILASLLTLVVLKMQVGKIRAECRQTTGEKPESGAC